MISNNIGARIEALRKKRGMTQIQLARELNVKRETINQWESNTRDLKTEKTIKLAEFFHVTCDYILRGIEAENVDFCKKTGLSQDAIKVLSEWNRTIIISGNSIIPTLNLLIEQNIARLVDEEGTVWNDMLSDERKEEATVLSAIEGYLDTTSTGAKFFITQNGDLIQKQHEQSALDFAPVRADVVNADEIIEKVLFGRIEYLLHSLREKLQEAKNNGNNTKTIK